jgi:uncharacterized protein (DUF169 family)
MNKASTIGKDFREKLAMKYPPVGFYYTDKKPDGAIGPKKAGQGCVMPWIFLSAKGKTVAFDKNAIGWECSAFYLGYREWIFDGIEYFLSDGYTGRECERLFKTPELAREFVESMRFPEIPMGPSVFKPLEEFEESVMPELVIFFATPDQLSALTFLLYFRDPIKDDLVVARLASACGSVVTLPMQYARRGEKKAVWGLHDITVRPKFPENLMTFTISFETALEMWEDMKDSFIQTSSWRKIVRRMISDS